MSEQAERAVAVTADQLGLQQLEEFEGHLEYDLGNLMASDPSPQDAAALKDDREAHCLETATQIMQSLVGQLFKLPGQLAGMGRVVDLPAPTFQIPRHKPLPAPRLPTRWEKFAQQKGIQKRKRSVKVWDEEQQEWRRRFGYRRSGDLKDIPIVEADADAKVGDDPFLRMEQDRKGRVKAGKKRELANVKNTLKKVGKSAVPSTLRLAATLPEHGKGKPTKRKEVVDDIRQASRAAGVGTASMGKFDKRAKGEAAPQSHLGIKRRKFEPVVGNTTNETAKAATTAARIIASKADNIAEMEKAAAIPRQLNNEWLDDEPGLHKKKPGKGKRKLAAAKAKGSTKSRKKAEAKGKGRR